MKYRIIEYIGDYPIEGQKYYCEEFDLIIDAEKAAIEEAKKTKLISIVSDLWKLLKIREDK